MDIDPAVVFARRGSPPDELRIPFWLSAGLVVSVLLGLIWGGLAAGPTAFRVCRAVMHGAGVAYLFLSLVDVAEHFRLERLATGQRLRPEVIPLGESLNHGATGLVLVSWLILSGPIAFPPGPRDFWTVAAPAAFLALGWRDEIVYHRRRCSHREDLLHTVSHLAAATFLTTAMAVRVFPWPG